MVKLVFGFGDVEEIESDAGCIQNGVRSHDLCIDAGTCSSRNNSKLSTSFPN